MDEDKASRDVLDALTGHQRREQIKKEKEETRKQKEAEAAHGKKKKNYLWIGIILLVLVGFAVVVGWMVKFKPETYTDREVHWHAYVELSLCGVTTDLPCFKKGEGTVHGESFCGEPTLHHHFDNTIHLEGLIQKKEDIALGRFFDITGIAFDKDKILNYTNGDLCPDGQPGVLKMYVNERPREDFRDYIPFATQDARKQIIKLAFESETS